MEICLSDGTSYISFRGTDDTIVGWKEDFNLSMGVVPAQERAVEYLRRIAGSLQEMVRVGGHSKGGNLAVYGAVMCKEIHPWILQVYSNDGPGFPESFWNFLKQKHFFQKSPGSFQNIRSSEHFWSIPKNRFLLQVPTRGCCSTTVFLGSQWKSFRQQRTAEQQAETFVSILHKWIDGMDVEQKKVLIEDLFSTIEASGSENLSEIQAGGLKSFTAC